MVRFLCFYLYIMKKISLFIVLILLFGFTLHKYHLSLTKIKFTTKNQSVQITMRCFIDDIENVVNKKNKLILELATKIEVEKADSLLRDYLLEKFKIQINNKERIIKYLGKEYEKDIVYFYLEIDSITSIQHIKVTNRILLNTFEDQLNIIKLTIDEEKKTFFLKNGDYLKNIDY